MSLKIITLDNGLRIALERNDNARTCSLGAWVASGSAYETAQTAGVSHSLSICSSGAPRAAPRST